MKKFIETCYKCNVKVVECHVVKHGIEVYCLKCPKCDEQYFTTSELMRLDSLRKRREEITIVNPLKQKLKTEVC